MGARLVVDVVDVSETCSDVVTVTEEVVAVLSTAVVDGINTTCVVTGTCCEGG